MAEKRMFSKQIIDSDAFLSMPLSTQALYFHLNMRADDDGFADKPKTIQRMVGAAEDDLKLLIAKRYVLIFESGVIVIKHWRIHNTIRNDRYNETVYLEEKSLIELKDNKSYTENKGLLDDGLPLGNQMEPQYRKEKNSIGLDNKSIVQNDCTEKVSTKEIDVFFESIWNIYPLKRGKGQVSDSKKRHLFDIGFDEMKRAIDRYKADLENENWRKPQNGSTFFNSGYVDYLDKNYVSGESKGIVKKKQNDFNSFPQRSYTKDDYSNMEARKLAIQRGEMNV